MNGLDPELAAMASISAAFDVIEDQSVKNRVLRWATDKFGDESADIINESVSYEPEKASQSFNDFVDLYDAARPSSRIDRALVAAYWLQVIGENKAWNSFGTNKVLKDLGYGIDGISKIFVAAQKQSPALVMQTSKNGKTAQAKKTYKLTQAGINQVERMFGE
jgi:hypothetical protein